VLISLIFFCKKFHHSRSPSSLEILLVPPHNGGFKAYRGLNGWYEKKKKKTQLHASQLEIER